MEVNKDIFLQIKGSFVEAIDSLSKEYKGSSLTDIFIVVDKESGEVAFFDDEENNVAKTVIDGWIDLTGEDDESDGVGDDNIVTLLRSVTEEMDNEGLFSSLDLFKPFSVNYADDTFAVIEELLLIDDDSTIKLDNDFMEKFDREFDEFLEKLLKE